MEQSFSQRMGLKPIKASIIQVNSVDDDLRMSLWNDFVTNAWGGLFPYQRDDFAREIWRFYFKRPIDAFTPNFALKDFKEYFFSCEWFAVYDFIEFIVKHYEDRQFSVEFVAACNVTLERELSAYRFIGKTLVQMTADQEIAEIEEALGVTIRYTQHLDKAVELLDRKAPDYANSIKESISAVEAICQLIVGDTTVSLGKALARLESKIGPYHHSLRNAFNQLYEWTSDAEGIRHGKLGESGLGLEDAKFMLIVCSAFINYLVAKAEKAGIKLS